jgi:hypothetical protein
MQGWDVFLHLMGCCQKKLFDDYENKIEEVGYFGEYFQNI